MRLRYLSLIVLVPLLLCCTKPENNNNQPEEQEQEKPTPTDPTDEENDLDPQVKDGDVILVTDAIVEKFLTEVTYPENDYKETHILDDVYAPTAPGKYDKPQKYTIRWEGSYDEVTARLWEDDGWNRDFTVYDNYLTITNLRPNANYHFEVKAGDKVVTSGSFKTTGHVHQVFFSSGVRNARDLGGWKTKDGSKTVKYRKIYRGGRMENSKLTKSGKKEVLAEGIRAQLDLRGHTTSGSQEYLDNSPLDGYPDADSKYTFLAPCIEEGYTTLLRDDQEKAKQCFQFIAKCVREDKPVYFHCSLGRDRTGTVAMMILGVLGVNEGDISKEYELTQFAPHGWATSDGEKPKMTRRADYKGAATYIWENFAKKADGTYDEFSVGMEKYLISIGITKEEIDEFRGLMLE